MKTRAINAVRNGPTDIVTSTLATLVSVSATMKAVNITLQHTPEIHKAGLPPSRILANTSPALEERQDHHQRAHGEEAAPERDLEAARVLQLARDDPGGRPHQGHRHHQEDRPRVREFHFVVLVVVP